MRSEISDSTVTLEKRLVGDDEDSSDREPLGFHFMEVSSLGLALLSPGNRGRRLSDKLLHRIRA